MPVKAIPIPGSSSTTVADLVTDYLANRDYRAAGGSVTKAQAYEIAISGLLLLRGEEFHHGETQTRERQNLIYLEGELKLVREWLSANSSTYTSSKPASRTVHPDFGDFR